MAAKGQYICPGLIILSILPVTVVGQQSCAYSISYESADCHQSVITAPGCLTTVTVRLTNVPSNQLEVVQVDGMPKGASVSYLAATPIGLSRLSSSSFNSFNIDALVIFSWTPDLVNAGKKSSFLIFVCYF